MDRWDAWSHPNWYVFPELAQGRRRVPRFHHPYAIAKWRAILKSVLRVSGLIGYSGHSFRAGGATDLFACGVSIQTVQKFGRWKSMAVLLYYKQEATEIAKTVGSAYGKLHSSLAAEFSKRYLAVNN
jgi:integrase